MKNFWLPLTTVAILTACGGSSSEPTPTAATTAPGTTNENPTWANGYAAVLAQLNTNSGLTSPSVSAAFTDDYLDAGMTKPRVVDALGKEAVAMNNSSEHSLFPQVALSNVALTGCDPKNVCTLTGTLTNTDGDGTAVDFSTKVVNSGATYRLLGDQLEN